jgi:predicted GNAT family acetyltransferase
MESPEQTPAIKRITPEDWEKLRDVRLMMVTDSPQAFGDTATSTLARSEEEWRSWAENAAQLYVEDGDVIVAAATVRFDDREGHWMVNGVWTHPDYRGRGYASRLVERCIAEARRQGATELFLSVRDTQAAAQHVYESLGFIRVEDGDYVTITGEGQMGKFFKYKLEL